jgi:hypothetical protein
LLSKSVGSKNAKSMKKKKKMQEKMQETNARNKCKRKMQVRNAKKSVSPCKQKNKIKIRLTMQEKN